ncbi:MAG: metallopeptidase TldD-related protein [Sandaracinaceae bacterium]
MTGSRQSASRLVRLLSEEAHRALAELRAPRQRRPYYVSYLVRDQEHHLIDARFGTLFADEVRRSRACFADVRVGSYRYDHVRDGGLADNSTKSESHSYASLPIGDRPDGIRFGLWQLTEARYREAMEDLLEKRADELHYRDPNRSLPAFERRDPVVDKSLPDLPELDRDYWRAYVEQSSAVGKKHEGIYGCTVELSVRHVTRLFASSEGSTVVSRQPLWQLSCLLDLTSDAGITVPWNVSHFVTDPDELPSLTALKAEIRRAVTHMRHVAAAPTLRAYSGPVLLDPKPAGLLMHEALGHRLEGSRLLSSGEGQTFRDALGDELLPDFLSMYDDPTCEAFEERSLVGHYRYDDEGVEASRADLVKSGHIAGFVTSRAGIQRDHVSNGHARNEAHERPMSRMGVTMVEAEGGVSDADLTRELLAEVERRRLPFGVHVRVADSGETATKSYDFQAFLGQIRTAELVFPNGERKLVRDVNFVGTPLNAIRGIVRAGRRRELDNSWCGAESGSVPVSTISPALLVKDLELQSSERSPNAPYSYPLPWARNDE